MCAEIEILTLCHTNLPEGVARDDITDEISERLEEINKLNRTSSTGASVMQQVAYGVSTTLALGGFLSGSYAFVCLGALIAFFALVMFDASDH